jgi:glycosyltransferase involved in cell wall biosynthesis
MNSVSVVIPVYNAELSLQKLLGQLAPAMEAVTTSFEVILVDDCSRDGSWGIIKSLQAADSRVRGIRLSRNYGQHNALRIRSARCPACWQSLTRASMSFTARRPGSNTAF